MLLEEVYAAAKALRSDQGASGPTQHLGGPLLRSDAGYCPFIPHHTRNCR
jgi:hypothetical protein